jgi:FtsZ-interacting cell division protein ZipA
MPELRWALLIVGLLFLAGLAWWEMRRPRRGLPRADARPELHTDVRAARQEPSFDIPPAQRSLHAALGPDFELPQMHAHDFGEPEPVADADAEADDDELAQHDAVPRPEMEPDAAHAERAPQPVWPREGERRILALRVVPQPPARFGGRSLRQALEDSDYVHGVYGIYHQCLDDGRVFSSAANLTRPGSFDPANMDAQFFHGLNVFTVLPGPLPAERALEVLAASAAALAQLLDAVVQDDVGRLLTPGRLAEMKSGLSSPPGPTT